MKAILRVECETGVELVAHLKCVTNHLIRKINQTKVSGEMTDNFGRKIKSLYLTDNNCYGDHIMTVRNFSIGELLHDVPEPKKTSIRNEAEKL
jgi:hypothetical protein